jgi:lysozyme
MSEAVKIACNLAKKFEGFRGMPYLCPAGVPTIGYGSTQYADGKHVTLQDNQISEPEAMRLLTEVMTKCLEQSIGLCPNLAKHSNNRQAAIADFVYNLGASRLASSTLRTKILEEKWAEVPGQLMRWVHAGALILEGLKKRRLAECELVKA